MGKQVDRESNEGPRTLWLVLGLFLLFFHVSNRHSAQDKKSLRQMSQKITSAWNKSKEVSEFGDEEKPWC